MKKTKPLLLFLALLIAALSLCQCSGGSGSFAVNPDGSLTGGYTPAPKVAIIPLEPAK